MATLLLAAAAGAVLVLLVRAGAGITFGGLAVLLVYYGMLVTAGLALLLAATLGLAGGQRRYSRALALCLATITFGVLLILVLPFTPGEGTLGGIVSESAVSVAIMPVLLVGSGAFLRFAVLFPRPLTTAEIGQVGRMTPDDSLGRFDRMFARFWRSEPGSVSAGDGGASERALDRLVNRLPPKLRRLARLELVADGGQLVTRPRLLWVTVAALSAIPVAIWSLSEAAAALEMPLAPDGPLVWLLILAIFVVFLAVPSALLLGIALLRLGYALADSGDRRRMRWIVESLNALAWGAIAMGPFLVLGMLGVRSPLIELGPPVILGLLPVIVVTGLAVAVFYDGALEPGLVIRKSTFYGLFGFGLAFLFAIVEELVTRHLTATLGLPDGTGTLVASGAIAAVVGALHGRFRRAMDRNLPDPGGTSPALVDGDPAGRRR